MDTEGVPLLEREAQLASLGEYAGEARHGDGRMVLVAGEPQVAGFGVDHHNLHRAPRRSSWSAELNLRDHAQAVVLACETGLVMPGS